MRNYDGSFNQYAAAFFSDGFSKSSISRMTCKYHASPEREWKEVSSDHLVFLLAKLRHGPHPLHRWSTSQLSNQFGTREKSINAFRYTSSCIEHDAKFAARNANCRTHPDRGLGNVGK